MREVDVSENSLLPHDASLILAQALTRGVESLDLSNNGLPGWAGETMAKTLRCYARNDSRLRVNLRGNGFSEREQAHLTMAAQQVGAQEVALMF